MGENELRHFAALLLSPIQQEIRDLRTENGSRFDRIEETLDKYGDKIHETAQKTAVIINDIFAIKKHQDEARTVLDALKEKETNFLAEGLKIAIMVILSISGYFIANLFLLHQVKG